MEELTTDGWELFALGFQPSVECHAIGRFAHHIDNLEGAIPSDTVNKVVIRLLELGVEPGFGARLEHFTMR